MATQKRGIKIILESNPDLLLIDKVSVLNKSS